MVRQALPPQSCLVILLTIRLTALLTVLEGDRVEHAMIVVLVLDNISETDKAQL